MTVKRVVSERTDTVGWRARFSYISDEDGKRKQPSKTFRLKKDAEAWLVKQQSEYMAGGIINGSTMPLRDYAAQWLARRHRSVRESTSGKYHADWRRYIDGAIGWKPIGSVRPGDIQKLYDDLGENGLGASAIRGIHSILKQIFEAAAKDRLIIIDPTAHRDLPSMPDESVDYWTREELESFLDFTKDHYSHHFWRLLATSGMRVSEAAALTWDDIDESRRAIRVNKTVRKNFGTGYHIGKGAKSATSNRVVFVPASTLMSLRIQKSTNEQTNWPVTSPAGSDQLIFRRPNDGSYRIPTALDTIFNRLVRKSGLKRVTPHGLRHTYATIAITNGMKMKVLQKQLGHKTLAMTMDLYAHVDEELQSSANDTMESLFPDESTTTLDVRIADFLDRVTK